MFCYDINYPWILGIALAGALWGWYAYYRKHQELQRVAENSWEERKHLSKFYQSVVGEAPIFDGEGITRRLMWNYATKKPGRPEA